MDVLMNEEDRIGFRIRRAFPADEELDEETKARILRKARAIAAEEVRQRSTWPRNGAIAAFAVVGLLLAGASAARVLTAFPSGLSEPGSLALRRVGSEAELAKALDADVKLPAVSASAGTPSIRVASSGNRKTAVIEYEDGTRILVWKTGSPETAARLAADYELDAEQGWTGQADVPLDEVRARVFAKLDKQAEGSRLLSGSAMALLWVEGRYVVEVMQPKTTANRIALTAKGLQVR